MSESSDDVARAWEEFGRQRRLVDQALTMQAHLRDRDRMIGTTLLCGILVISVIGVAFAFAEPGTWLAWLSVGTFALVLVELVLDRRGAARGRAEAVRVLSALKAQYRVLPKDTATLARLTERYSQVMDSVPVIPERAFNPLKAAHLRKVEISKLLSEQPGISYRKARALVARRYKDGTS